MIIGIGVGVGLSRGGGVGAVTLYSDDFNRGDSNTTLDGSGKTYTVSAGTAGISSGEAYHVTNTDGAVVLTTAGVGTGAYTASCRMKGSLTDGANSARMGLIFKGVDNSNFLYLSPVAGSLTLRKFDVGVGSQLGSPASYTMTNNTYSTYTATYDATTTLISVYVDGVLRISYNLNTVPADVTKFGAANKIGWRHSYSGAPATTARIDDLLVTT
jgi:hypothetical protein